LYLKNKDFYRKEIEIDGDPAYLEILDTAGTEQFASMRDLYIKNGQGFLIVYSVTSKQSFQDIRVIRDQILKVKGTDRVPIVIAANKCDLVGVDNARREVSTEEGLVVASEWSVPYVETSAKNAAIVNSLFAEIVKEVNLKLKTAQSYSNSRKDKKKRASKFLKSGAPSDASGNDPKSITSPEEKKPHKVVDGGAEKKIVRNKSRCSSTRAKISNSILGCCFPSLKNYSNSSFIEEKQPPSTGQHPASLCAIL
jgi:small GTP-binding protein